MTKQYLGAYINFAGRARGAMEFYRKVLGGKLDLLTVNEQGVPRPAGPGDRVTDARLETDGGPWPWAARTKTGSPRYSTAWPKAARSRCRQPRGRSGAAVGWLTDKFGINWMVSIDKA